MKILYIECNMGAAGDMLMGALLELLPDKAVFLSKINGLGIPGVVVSAEDGEKMGVHGTHMHVLIDGEEEMPAEDVADDGTMLAETGHDHESSHHHDHHHDHDHADCQEGHHHDHEFVHSHEHEHEHEHEHHHHHSGMDDIMRLIEGMDVSDKVKNDAIEIYRLIADAEAKVHSQPAEEIHFHEVGSLDAVTDVVGNCLLMDMIGAEKVVVSPIHVGSGQVKCAHGILPVPAPATALILKGAPIYGGEIRGELCTPTGAAVLIHFADEFGPMPAMAVEKTGYGIGTKDFPRANIVRAFLGEAAEETGGAGQAEACGRTDKVLELSVNLDDMTGEEMGFAMEQLLAGGALDVYYTPIIMKKSRPAYKLTVMCMLEDKKKMVELLFRHTTSLGIRIAEFDRCILERHGEEVMTEMGKVRVKVSEGYGVKTVKAEYDDVAEIAKR